MKKEELISALTTGRAEFLKAIEDIPQQEMTIPGIVGQWSLKDMLVHLTRWEAELVKLLWQAKQGTTPTTIHFTPETVDQVNERWYQQSSSRSMDVVWDDFLKVREQTIRRVDGFGEQELNDVDYYPWLDSSPLWKWIADDSFGHEAEHIEDIRAWRSRKGKTP
ncbi:MAG: ClbS/DfsB family four-helix bundle protein [Anaerolineales bacterium]